MAQVDRSFIGEGIIYARKYGSQDPLLDIGNCDSFNVAYATEKKQLPNYRGGGGNRNVKEQVTGVTAAIGMYDLTPENIARVTNSVIASVPTTAIVDEQLVAGGVIGELIPFNHLPDTAQTVTVRTVVEPPAEGVELIAGTDYVLTPHGIISKSAAVTAAGVSVSYTPLKASALHMLAGAPVELELYIAGLNDAQSGEPFSLRPRRAKFGLTSELPVFSTEYVKLASTVELLADDLVQGAGISKFCQMDVVDKVA